MTSRKFFSLFLLCALVPLFAAKVSLAMGWFSHDPVNKGYWLEHEVKLLPTADMYTAAWRVVYVAPETCTQMCEQVFYSLQQLYTGLGRKQINIQSLVMADSSPSMLDKFSSISWFPIGNQTGQSNVHELRNYIVIVNRDGLGLLRYPVSPDQEKMKIITKDIRADLLRLMNYDRSGT